MFMQGSTKVNIRVRVRRCRCCGCATWIFTKTIAANRVSSVTLRRRCCRCAGGSGRHGIYISHSAIGLDTGYNHQSPLSCLSLPDFNLYQTYADGREETYQITSFIPETISEMQRKAGLE